MCTECSLNVDELHEERAERIGPVETAPRFPVEMGAKVYAWDDAGCTTLHAAAVFEHIQTESSSRMCRCASSIVPCIHLGPYLHKEAYCFLVPSLRSPVDELEEEEAKRVKKKQRGQTGSKESKTKAKKAKRKQRKRNGSKESKTEAKKAKRKQRNRKEMGGRRT
jgi:hypothetical protein